MNKFILAFAASLCWLPAAYAKAPIEETPLYHLTLQEAIDRSITASKQLQLSDAVVAENEAALRAAKDRRLPDLTVSGAYLRLAQPDVKLKFQQGGSDTASGNNEKSPTVNQAMYGIANASLPLFAGGAIRSGIKASGYLAAAAKLDATRDRAEVIQNAIAAYANLYKAKAAVRLVEQSLVQSDERVRQFTRLEQNGLLARNDLLKAQLQSSNVSLSLLDARNTSRIAEITMNILLGLPEETVLSVDSISGTGDARTFDEWQTAAINSRQDLQARQYRIKAAGAAIDAERASHYPALALTGGYVAAYVPNVITITNAVNVGLGLSYNVGNLWKGNAAVAQARARRTQAEVAAATATDAISLEVAQRYQQYLSSVQKIEVYNTALEQATENYRIVKNKYDNALATTTELLDADVAQLQAQLNYTFGRADASVSYSNLLLAAGMLDANQPVITR